MDMAVSDYVDELDEHCMQKARKLFFTSDSKLSVNSDKG